MPATGIGRYVRQLVENLRLSVAVRLKPFVASGQALPEGASRLRPGLSAAERAVWEQVAFPLAVARCGASVAHLPYYEGSPLMPVPLVLTVQDVDTVIRKGEYPRAFRLYYNRLFFLLARRAAVIVVPSRATAEALSDIDDSISDKLHIIPYGHDPQLLGIRGRITLGATGRVLYCGGYGVRKRLDVLIRAFRRVRAKQPNAHLVLVGQVPDGVRRLIHDERLSSAVELTGEVSDCALRRLYAEADVAVYPTANEGFGFPALEALAAGVPLVASECSSIQEIVGDCAALVPVGAINEFADAILEALEASSPVQFRARNGLQRARRFTWSRCVELHVDAYRVAARSS
ncbi:MAG: glycosyltransferase family 4 protein [Actinomycetota bacterium]|nr:glycosyltransferase family 4 protein [Actinomycetota bacterium]